MKVKDLMRKLESCDPESEIVIKAPCDGHLDQDFCRASSIAVGVRRHISNASYYGKSGTYPAVKGPTVWIK